MNRGKSRPVLGALLLFGGAWTTIFGAFWNVVNLEDQGPRCLGGCSPSATQYYWTVYEASTLLIVLGLIAVVLGAWFLKGARGIARVKSTEKAEAPSPRA